MSCLSCQMNSLLVAFIVRQVRDRCSAACFTICMHETTGQIELEDKESTVSTYQSFPEIANIYSDDFFYTCLLIIHY